MIKKPPKGKSLAELNPKLANEWHPTKNDSLTPFDVTTGSDKKVWWKCDKGSDHEWIARVGERFRGRGCPVCAGQKAVLSNCLSTLHPDLAKEWHPTKNGDLTPYDILPGSNKKVWWKCDKGSDHEWIARVIDRSKRGDGCVICSGKKIVLSNCLAIVSPDLAKEWHPTKNVDLTPFDITEGSNKKVWWKCEKGYDHEWHTTIVARKQGGSCPVCSSRKIVLSNSLSVLRPELVKFWHPTKNGNLGPEDIGPNSGVKVWWKCNKAEDHEWNASPNKTTLCPMCVGQRVVLSNCLATTDPIIAKQWHPNLNGEKNIYNVTRGSDKSYWWKCDKGENHEWKVSINSRTSQNSNCPYCTLTPQSKQELTITFELIQFFEINPKGFKTRVKGKLWTIDIYIPELKFGIEFDGSYWHKDKCALDKLKTKNLEEHGFSIMRVRQDPLKAITDIDIISKIPFNAKVVTNEILKHITKAYSLDLKRIKKIKKYLLKEGTQNGKGLDAYIDMILTDKANHKKQ